MARNGSGTMSAPAGQPAVAGTTITAAAHNDLVNDIVAEITDSLSRSGKGGMLAALKAVDGALGGPGFSFNDEATSGLFRAGAGDLRLAILGALVAKFTAAGLDVTGALGVSGAASVGAGLDVTGALTVGGAVSIGGVITGHARAAADFTRANNTPANVTGLAFAVEANANYEFEFVPFISTTDGTKGVNFTITGPAAPTAISATRHIVTAEAGASAVRVDAIEVNVFGELPGISSIRAGRHADRIVGFLRNGANAGTVQLQCCLADAAGATVTVHAGSWVTWRKV